MASSHILPELLLEVSSSQDLDINNFAYYHTEFDPQFNAITGLNGSGKSNILDAICFVLGITRL